MANIRIGHAFKGEAGSYNQNPGDSLQTTGPGEDDLKGEVRIDTWYKKAWEVVFRPKTSTLAENSARACEAACNNSCIGYDKTNRGTLNSELNKIKTGDTYTYEDIKRLSTKCECDCSSLMNVCAIAGGANLKYGGGNATGSLVSKSNIYVNSGDYEDIRDEDYLTSDKYLKRGDIVVRSGHTFMVLGDGPCSCDTLKIGLTINNVKINTQEDTEDFMLAANAVANITMTKISDKQEVTLTKEDIDLYNWRYKLTSNIASTDSISNAITFSKKEIEKNNKTIKLSGLKPNITYKMQIYAILKAADPSDAAATTSSPKVMFTTPINYPTPVRKLKADLNKNGVNNNISMSFEIPLSWKASSNEQKRGCRLYLIVNGRIVAYNDNLFSTIAAENMTITKNFTLEQAFPNFNFKTKNKLQLGIVPWVKLLNSNNTDIAFDLDCLVSSKPFYTYSVENYSLVDKIYTKQEKNYIRAIVHDINRGN